MARVPNIIDKQPDPNFGRPINTQLQTLRSPEQAAFQEINDLTNLYEMFTRPVFTPDPKFDVKAALEKSPLTPTHGGQLAGALSQGEFDQLSTRINRSNQNRKTLAGSGVNGALSLLAAGIVSPTSFIPLIGEARGVKAVAQTVALSATAAGLQELPSSLNNPNKTSGETAFAIAAGTVLGSILGGAARYLSSASKAAILRDLERPTGKLEIQRMSNVDAKGKPYVRDISPSHTPEADMTVPVGNKESLPLVKTREVDVHTNFGPNDNYIAGKQAAALRDMEEARAAGKTTGGQARGTNGAVTTHIGGEGDAPVFLPVKDLKDLKGVNGENPRIGEPKFDALGQTVAKDGFNAVDHPIHIRVNHLGEAFVVEGNTRLAYAQAKGVEAVRVKVDWMNGSGRGDAAPWDVATILGKTLKGDKRLPRVKAGEVPSRAAGSAESHPVNFVNLLEHDPISAWINRRLAGLTPVTRGLTQRTSPSASYFTARFSDAGLKTEQNLQGIPHAPEGTLEWRVEAHVTATAKFSREIDAAYASHIFAGAPKNKIEQFQRAAKLAQLRSGFGALPDGKLSWADFQTTIFDLGNTGAIHPDVHVMKAVKAQHDFYAYFRDKAEEAYQERLKVEPDTRRMFDPEADLGPDIMHFAHHNFDTKAVANNAQEFHKDFAANAEELQTTAFQKAHESYAKEQAKRNDLLQDIDQPQTVRRALAKQLEGENKAVEADPDVVQYKTDLDAMRKQASTLEGADQASVREDIKGFQENAPEPLKAKLKQVRENKARVKKLKGVAKKGPREKLIKDTKKARDDAETNFDTSWRKKGATGGNIASGVADFKEYGAEMAELLYNKLVGLDSNAQTLDILFGERGPELARVLKMPFETKRKYLFTDAERVIRQYAHKISPDVELYRLTGSVTGQPILNAITDDFSRLKGALNAHANDPAFLADLAKKLNPDSAGLRETPTIDKLNVKLIEAEKARMADMTVLIKRLRNQRGFPKDSSGILYRMGQGARDVNVFRYMGNVVISSVQDVARPVFKHGVLDTYKAGWEPLIRDLPQIKMSREVAKELGIALDPELHNRFSALAELNDNFSPRKTVPERALGYLANKTGKIALFDRWTAEMKMIAFRVNAAQFSSALRKVMTNEGPHSLESSHSYLSSHGIDPKMAAKIWKQFNLKGGSTTFDNGLMLPNMEMWKDYKTMAAYRAANIKAVNDMIITPGLDRPSWMDYNIGTKLVGQFRTFNFVSTNRTIMASLQEPDAAMVQGIIGSLGLGAVSYYLWATSVGGRAQEEMLQFDAAKWADASIDRSGLLAIFSEPLRIASRIPGLRDYTSFSGSRTTTRRASGLMGSVLGPSFDLAERTSNIVLGASDPTKSTLHQLRLVTPYQNVFYLRRLLTSLVEQPLGASLPARRGG